MYFFSFLCFLLSAGSILCEICSDDETIKIQTKLQTCSHSTATSFYETIQDLTSVKIISDKLCNAFNRIGTVCVKHLSKCFANDDARELSKLHLEEMKEFLLTIVLGKGPENILDNCKVAIDENIDDVKDDDYSVPEVESEVETYDERFTEDISVKITATDDNMIKSSTESRGNAIESVDADEDIAVIITTVENQVTESPQGTPSTVIHRHEEKEDKTMENIPSVHATDDISDPAGHKVKDYLDADIKNVVNETNDNLADEPKNHADEALIVETEEEATNGQNIEENKIEKSYYASAMITVEYHSGAYVIYLSYLAVIWVTLVTFDRGL